MPRRIVVITGSGSADLLKSHVKDYNRKDGTHVSAHDDKRQKKGDEGYSHPHVVGKAELTDPHAEGAHDASGMKFAGTQYHSTGKSGQSFHDQTPVREFEAEDGHRVWMDHHSRVHADGTSEVPKLRAKFEAHKAEFDDGGEKGGEKDAAPGGDKAKPKGKEKAAPEGQAAADEDFEALKQHPMFSESDLEYFKGKGYTPDEIKAVWDRDQAAGHKPVEHKKAPDVTGVAGDPDHYKKKGGGTLAKALRHGLSLLVFGGNRG